MIASCPHCNSKYKIDETKIDNKVPKFKCPKCSNHFTVNFDKEIVTNGQESSKILKKNKKILIVDDEKFFRKLLADIIISMGYDYVEAQDGEEALLKIKHEIPDLIITDLLLPKLTGFDLVKEVRKGKLGENIPILVITSVYKDTSHVMKLQSLGANDFIDKSFKPEQLVERINKLLK